MRSKLTKEFDGPQRQTKSNGDIVLTTWKNGIKHGLTVAAVNDEVGIYVDKNNKTVFNMVFDKHGKVTKRHDSTDQFADVQPDFFMRRAPKSADNSLIKKNDVKNPEEEKKASDDDELIGKDRKEESSEEEDDD